MDNTSVVVKPFVPPPYFSPEWLDQQWGRMVIGIGAGRGREVLVDIVNEVALDRYDAGRKAAEARIRTLAKGKKQP